MGAMNPLSLFSKKDEDEPRQKDEQFAEFGV